MESILSTILLSLLAMVAIVGLAALVEAIDAISRGKLTSFFIKPFSGGRDE